MLTASASITKLSPGIYPLRTVLKSIDNPKNKGGRPRLPSEQRKPRVHRYIKKKDREKIWRDTIYTLPDDERELWNRVVI